MAVDETLVERVRVLVAAAAPFREARMFGGVAFLVGGHMAVAASGQGGLMVRTDPDTAAAVLDQPGVTQVEMRGRPVRGWVRVDEAALTDAALTRWVDTGLAFVATLPPKG